MKLSNKLLILLLLGVVIGFVFSNFQLKKQYENIDGQDAYWDFKQKENLSFSNITIEGGNNVYLSIVHDPNRSGMAYKEPFEDLVRYVVENDTLRVKFDKSLTVGILKWKRRKKLRFVIFYDHLKSLMMDNALLDLEIKSEQIFNLIAKGVSDVIIKAEGVTMDSLNIATTGNAKVEFVSRKKSVEHPMNIDFLTAKIRDSSAINLRKIVAKHTDLQLDQESGITLDSGILSSISKK